MKACPSCNVTVDDDTQQCGCGYKFDEGVSGLENVELGEAEGEVAQKTCVMCRQSIPREALRCRYCGSQVGIWDGSVFGQFFVLLFTNLWILWGTFLPWYGAAGVGMPRGVDTLSGFLIAFVAFGAVCASLASIWTRRLLFWPTLLSFFLVLFFCVFRVQAVLRDSGRDLNDHFSRLFTTEWAKQVNGILNLFGPGYVVVGVGALFILVFLVMSVFSGARSARAKQQAQEAARAGARATRTRKTK